MLVAKKSMEKRAMHPVNISEWDGHSASAENVAIIYFLALIFV